MVPIKLRIIFGIIFALGMISLIGMAIQETQAEKSTPEIDQNQVEDEISRTIIVKLEDGISSSDDIK